MAHPLHQQVRERFDFRCGYCGVSEAECGGELTVDHHQPVSAGGGENEANLVYSCFRCNTYKGDFAPSAADNQLGQRVLHPLIDSIDLHVRENEVNGLLEPLTPTGRFHIELMRLNRPQLVEHRLQLRLRVLISESHRLLTNENETLRSRIELLEQYLSEIQQRLSNDDSS
jgi:hypothetical protein